jgi:hypothetical protein
MKKAFLLIVVPALLAALGFAQTPGASIKTDQTNIKGCLGGSDGNYTVAEDNTGHIFKITTSSVDLKAHLGHDVTLIGHKASVASSGAAGDSLDVTELNMISERCAAAAASTAPVSTPSDPANIPPAPAAAPAAPVTTPSETAVTPAVATASPAAPVTTPSETAVTPAAAAAHPTRTRTHPRTLSTPAVVAASPAATASTPSETASTPDAAATKPAATGRSPSEIASSETASTPAAAATKPAATTRSGSLWILISVAVLVIVIGTMAPLIGRWKRRKLLERSGAQNLSFSREASSDQDNNDKPVVRKAA